MRPIRELRLSATRLLRLAPALASQPGRYGLGLDGAEGRRGTEPLGELGQQRPGDTAQGDRLRPHPAVAGPAVLEVEPDSVADREALVEPGQPALVLGSGGFHRSFVDLAVLKISGASGLRMSIEMASINGVPGSPCP